MVQAQRRIAVPKSVVQLQRRIRIKCEAQGRRALESAATVLERHFNAYAAHGSGLLSRIEFVKLMREGLEMKPPHYEIAAIMKLYPGPGEHSGRLDQSSFIRDVLQQQKPKGARHGQIEALSATARSDNASTVISTERSTQSKAAFGFGFGGGFGTHHTAGDGQAPSGNVRVALTRPVKAFFRRVIEIARSTGPGTLKAQCMRVFIKMDTDSSGTLGHDELCRFVRGPLEMDVGEGAMRQIILFCDSDFGGTISCTELVAHVLSYDAHVGRAMQRKKLPSRPESAAPILVTGRAARSAAQPQGVGRQIAPARPNGGGGTALAVGSRLPSALAAADVLGDPFYNEMSGGVPRLRRELVVTEFDTGGCRRPTESSSHFDHSIPGRHVSAAVNGVEMVGTAHYQQQDVGGGWRGVREARARPATVAMANPASETVLHPPYTARVQSKDATVAPPTADEVTMSGRGGGIVLPGGVGGAEAPVPLEQRLARFQEQWDQSVGRIASKLLSAGSSKGGGSGYRSRRDRQSKRGRQMLLHTQSATRVPVPANVPQLDRGTAAQGMRPATAGAASASGSSRGSGGGSAHPALRRAESRNGASAALGAKPLRRRPATAGGASASWLEPSRRQLLVRNALVRIQAELNKRHMRTIDLFRSHRINTSIDGDPDDVDERAAWMQEHAARGDDLIDGGELVGLLASLGQAVSKAEAKMIIKELDTDNNGQIDVMELDSSLKAARRDAAAATRCDPMTVAARRVERDLRTARSDIRRKAEAFVKSKSFHRAVHPSKRTLGGTSSPVPLASASHVAVFQR